MSRYTKCKYCGRPIIFIKTPQGGHIPCDTRAVHYLPDKFGPEKMVTGDGCMVGGEIVPRPCHGSLVGMIPHRASCPKAGQHVASRPQTQAAPKRERAQEQAQDKAVQMCFWGTWK